MENTILLELKNITVSPPVLLEGQKLEPIISNISFAIHKGEWISVLGRNGSGKSTVAKVAAGYRVPGTAGLVIRHDDSELKGKPLPIVMQQPEASMIGATPWEDLLLLLEQNKLAEANIPLEAERALRSVGMGERLHQPIETLSGGQKQLVAIAGCIAMNSPLLVLDEVTSMLDPEACFTVLNQVRQLNESGTAVVWITQKLEELREADRMIAMNEGSIEYDGQAEAFFERTSPLEKNSLCEKLGFEAPYAAQVAWELEALGLHITPFPFTAEMLAKAVKNDD